MLLATSRLWSYVVEWRQIKEWRAALRRNDVDSTPRRFVSNASLTSHARTHARQGCVVFPPRHTRTHPPA